MAGVKIITKNEKNVDEFPKVSKALLDVLHQMVPERCADSSESDRDIWIYSGQRQLVRFLQAKFDEQQGSGR
ncbi:MAG: hypothetical protein EB023_02300 [Flavobacteriia bacterium]|nr:hypothetical protein [Flavobacteriia bacterium]